METGPGSTSPRRRNQIRLDVALRVTDSVYDRAAGIVLEHWHGFELGAEAVAAGRKAQPRLPAIQRIVIPMADERTDALCIQPP